MKNVLFATTALIATAGFASADVTVGGFGYLGVTSSAAIAAGTTAALDADNVVAAEAFLADQVTTAGKAAATTALADAKKAAAKSAGAAASTNVSHAMRLTFAGSVETDSGVSFTASSRITISNNNDNGQLGHNKITMSASGLTLAVGATHGAMRNTARVATFHGFNNGSMYYTGGGNGVDNGDGDFAQNDGGNNIYVAYTAGDLKVAASTDVDGNKQEVGVSYTMNGFTVGAAADNANNFMLAAKYSGAGYNFGIGTNQDSDIVLTANYDIAEGTSIGLGVDMASGGDMNSMGVQVSHNLGGATVTGAVGQNQGNSIAMLGVQFSF